MKAIRTKKTTRKYRSQSGVRMMRFKRLLQAEKIKSLNWANYYKYFEVD